MVEMWIRLQNTLVEHSSSFICCVCLFNTKWFLLLRHWKGRELYFCIHFSSCLSALKIGGVFCPSPSGICILPRLRDCMWVFSAWFISVKYNRDTLLGLPSIKKYWMVWLFHFNGGDSVTVSHFIVYQIV